MIYSKSHSGLSETAACWRHAGSWSWPSIANWNCHTHHILFLVYSWCIERCFFFSPYLKVLFVFLLISGHTFKTQFRCHLLWAAFPYFNSFPTLPLFFIWPKRYPSSVLIPIITPSTLCCQYLFPCLLPPLDHKQLETIWTILRPQPVQCPACSRPSVLQHSVQKTEKFKEHLIN